MYYSKLLLGTLFSVLFMSCGSSVDYQRTENGIRTTIDSLDIEVSFYSGSIVRVVKVPFGKTVEKQSLAVTAKPSAVSFEVREKNNNLILETEEVQVTVDGISGAVSYASREGETLLAEQPGTALFTPFDDAGTSTFEVRQSFGLEPDEAIYGLGILQTDKMSQRNQKVTMIQGNTRDYIPFFQSHKGYGVFWDNYAPTTFEDDSTKTEFKSAVGDCIDYYFMYGHNADGVIADMRMLTGAAPMFPLWTFGFWQSKERYKTQQETIDVVKKYRSLGVPLDGIIQDWQYWGDNYHWNAMEFLNPGFPKPQQMVDDIHGLKARMIISIWSSFGPETNQYKDLKEKNMLLDFLTWPLSGKDVWPPDMNYPSGVRPYDPYNPEARDIYWSYLSNDLLRYGIDGWWMDSTEPDHMEFKQEDLNVSTHLGSFRKVRNAYPLLAVGGVYDHQRKETESKRVFILTRSAFAGQQRYGANTWSGDVVSSWSALRKQVTSGLNFSLCGIPHWNSDIGGFFLWDFPGKLEDPEYRELYVRWLEFGAFCPMMRSHGADAPREIYQFGEKGSRAYDAIEKFIKLRYRLLPYIYSAAWDVTANHSSMTRALVMDYPADEKARNIGDAYMFGKSLLVHPVTQPMYVKQQVSGVDTLNVEDFAVVKSDDTYLPEGVWYDFWTGEKMTGGKVIQRETPLDIIPVYVPAGSIIPFGPDVQYAEEKKWDNLEVVIYPGKDGTFVLYEDENDNYNYEDGAFTTITFSWDDGKRELSISNREGEFAGMLKERTFRVSCIDKVQVESSGQKVPVQIDVHYEGKATVMQFQ